MSARVCTCVHACVELTWNRQTHRAYTRCGICVYTRSHIRIYTQRQYSGVHTCVCLGACCACARARSRSVHTSLRTLRTTFSHRGAPQRFRRYSRPRVSGNVLPPLRSDRPFGRRVCVRVCFCPESKTRANCSQRPPPSPPHLCPQSHNRPSESCAVAATPNCLRLQLVRFGAIRVVDCSTDCTNLATFPRCVCVRACT